MWEKSSCSEVHGKGEKEMELYAAPVLARIVNARRQLWENPPAAPHEQHEQHPHETSPVGMDSLMSLGAPLKQFTSCVSGKRTPAKRGGAKGGQSVRRMSFTRRKSVSRRRSLPCSTQKVPDSWLRLYQDDLKRER
ncbi:hypothetical protein EYF80_029801 [Liparis tanakae]|uniref:Uncharacterized protein n=1 Tax=Liparis tanakae TaxID=230148 RepID=A0A4Z2H2F8_9TELE|nr:hypothetical protein EYF80_029801 [Liparis tanakae]